MDKKRLTKEDNVLDNKRLSDKELEEKHMEELDEFNEWE